MHSIADTVVRVWGGVVTWGLLKTWSIMPSVHLLLHQAFAQALHAQYSRYSGMDLVWGGRVTLGSAEDQVEHAICAFTPSSGLLLKLRMHNTADTLGWV